MDSANGLGKCLELAEAKVPGKFSVTP